MIITSEQFQAVCRAHWPTWDRMRPDHQSKWRVKMVKALRAIGIEVQW